MSHATVSVLADHRRPRVVATVPDLDRPTSRLRGRDAELLALGDRVSALANGEGGVMLVEGPAGIGKSALLSIVCEMARGRGVRTVSAEARVSRQTVPFEALFAALEESGFTVSGRAEADAWIVHELERLLEEAALEGPLLVAVDDLQWADGATLLALRTLPERLAGSPILWLFAKRTGDGRPAVHQTTRRLERHGGPRLVLGPLSRDAVAEVITDVLQTPANERLRKLAAPACGNPFVLVELLEGLRADADDAPPRRVTNLM